MIYQIRHTTYYRYAESVSNSQHDLHLSPRDLARQRTFATSLAFAPVPGVYQERTDYFGNRAAHVVLSTTHSELLVTARSRVEVLPMATCDPFADDPWETARVPTGAVGDCLHAKEMSFPSPYVQPWDELAAYAQTSFSPGRAFLAACLDLMGRIHQDFTYDPKATTVATPLWEVFRLRRGVCQDFAHLMIACLRALGLSARYVSGYLVTTAPPGQPRLQGADASHAWLAAYSPRFGFVDMDPTNNILVNDAHITLAIGRDFGDVTPLRGVILGGGRHELTVGVDVELEKPAAV